MLFLEEHSIETDDYAPSSVCGGSNVFGSASAYDPQILFKNCAIGDMSLKIRWMRSDDDGDGGLPVVYDPFVCCGLDPAVVKSQIPDARMSSLPTKIA